MSPRECVELSKRLMDAFPTPVDLYAALREHSNAWGGVAVLTTPRMASLAVAAAERDGKLAPGTCEAMLSR